MARNVNTTIEPIVILNINVIHTDGSIDVKKIKVDDMVSDLRFVKDGTIQTISGRVAKLGYKIAKTKRMYTNISKVRSYFKFDVTPDTIIIDNSEVNHSKLTEIPVREILEDAGTTDVERLDFYLEYGVSVKVLRSDTTTETITVMEGDVVSNLVYLYKGEEALIASGKLLAIKREDNSVNPIAFEMNVDGKLKEINILSLVRAGGAITPVSSLDSLASAIANQEEGGSVFIGEGIFTENLSFEKSVTICGAKAGIPAAKSTRDKVTFVGETIVSGKLSFATGTNVVLDGLVLTEKALLTLSDAASVEVKNCIITKFAPSTKRDFLITAKTGSPMKVVVDGCFIGAYKQNVMNADGVGVIYNLFELNCKLKDGSSFSNNYIQNGSSKNNSICVYDVEDGATINIENNVWEYAGNGIRIGPKGDAHCTINIVGNEYKSTDERNDGEWAGLLIFQPYGNQTTSMAHVTANISKTKHSDKRRIYYLFTSKTDPKFTEENAPVVYLNGTKRLAIIDYYEQK